MTATISNAIKTQQGISNAISETGEAVTTARKTTVNAVAAAVTILATEVARMNNDDTIVFDGITFTKKGSTDAEEGEFSNIAGLRDCVDEFFGDAWATSGTTNATLTSKIKGLAFNSIAATATIIEDTTANFDSGVDPSSAAVDSATLAVLANGDTVVFSGVTFVKAATTAAAEGEFADAAGLAACINEALGDTWTGAVNTGDVTIIADDNTEDLDGLDVMVNLFRATANGVNGTVGLKDMIVADADNLYVCTAKNTVNDANWKKVTLSSL